MNIYTYIHIYMCTYVCICTILSIACVFILFQSKRPLTADLSPFASQPQAIFMRVRPHRIRDGHGYIYFIWAYMYRVRYACRRHYLSALVCARCHRIGGVSERERCVSAASGRRLPHVTTIWFNYQQEDFQEQISISRNRPVLNGPPPNHPLSSPPWRLAH